EAITLPLPALQETSSLFAKTLQPTVSPPSRLTAANQRYRPTPGDGTREASGLRAGRVAPAPRRFGSHQLHYPRRRPGVADRIGCVRRGRGPPAPRAQEPRLGQSQLAKPVFLPRHVRDPEIAFV